MLLVEAEHGLKAACPRRTETSSGRCNYYSSKGASRVKQHKERQVHSGSRSWTDGPRETFTPVTVVCIQLETKLF